MRKKYKEDCESGIREVELRRLGGTFYGYSHETVVIRRQRKRPLIR
jgi:hypothetical protein